MVHRDIKPSNVLVDGDRVVVLDFGLAASAGGAALGGGTLGYMAPEQGLGAAGPAADWYALGVMVWEALVGRLPFAGSPSEVRAAKQRGPGALAGIAAAEGGAAAPELAALALALLEPDPTRRPDGAAVAAVLGAAAPTRPPMPRFVGRTGERAALDAAFAAARTASRTVLVRGPSGIGKSALVAAFAAELRAGGALVLADRCYERVAVPYKGLHGVAAALVAHFIADRDARTDLLDGPDLGLLPAVLPALVSLGEVEHAGRDSAPVRDPAERRARVFDAFAGLLARLATRTPLAILVDDVQWADRDGLALLGHVVAQVPRGLLVVATAADGTAVDPAWSAGAEVLAVGPLSRGDAAMLGAALLGEHDATTAALVDEAAGHPLHLAELVAHRHRGGAAGVRLEDAIAARVAELPAPSVRLLSLVALAGAPLPQGLLGDAAGLDGAAWWATLGALRAAHLVKSAGAGADDPVEPYHDRVRAAVADRLAAPARRAAHASLGAALERHPLAASRPELVADHLESAGEPGRAITYVEAAAIQAADALAFERAADLYRRALGLIVDTAGADTAAQRAGLPPAPGPGLRRRWARCRCRRRVPRRRRRRARRRSRPAPSRRRAALALRPHRRRHRADGSRAPRRRAAGAGAAPLSRRRLARRPGPAVAAPPPRRRHPHPHRRRRAPPRRLLVRRRRLVDGVAAAWRRVPGPPPPPRLRGR